MSLIILTIITIVTSPWFILITFEKIVPAKFYLPTISELLRNFFSYFSFDFLFFKGDIILKNSIPEVGVFPLWGLPFLLIGFCIVFSNIKKKRLVVIFLIISSVIASFFKPSPYIFCSIPLLFILSVIIALGINYSLKKFLIKKTLVKSAVIFLYLLFIFYNSFFSWHQYKVHYSKRLEQFSISR